MLQILKANKYCTKKNYVERKRKVSLNIKPKWLS